MAKIYGFLLDRQCHLSLIIFKLQQIVYNDTDIVL